jgi:hypothetical protein
MPLKGLALTARGPQAPSQSKESQPTAVIALKMQTKTRHKRATAPQSVERRMADFCGLLRIVSMWQKQRILLHYGK